MDYPPGVGGVGHGQLQRVDDPEIHRKSTLRRTGVSAECAVPKLPHEFDPKVIPKTDEQKERIREMLHKSYLFKSLDQEQTRVVVDAVEEEKHPRAELIIKQGDSGDKFYLLESGSVEVWIRKKPDQEEEKVKTYAAGDSFGELALLYDAPRAATVRASSDCVVWAMDRTTFRTILMYTINTKRLLYEKFLSTVPLLKSLSEYDRASIADVLEAEYFEEGDHIIVEGHPGERFYLIEEGTAEAATRGKVVMTYKKGDYFGELALINDEPRAATVTATSRCKCVSIKRDSFESLLGGKMPHKKASRTALEILHDWIVNWVEANLSGAHLC